MKLLMTLMPLLCAAAPIGQVRFDHPRELCAQPFDLRLTSTQAGATVVYTLDGSAPTANHGTTYREPIHISRTSLVRAAVFAGDSPVGRIATCSYLFPRDVATQNGAGLPPTWGENEGKPVPASYGISAEAAGQAKDPQGLPRALRAIPSLSIAMDPSDLFGPDRGIYTHPKENGAQWERKASVELIEPDGSPGFQLGCGIRIHGGWSRRPGSHSAVGRCG